MPATPNNEFDAERFAALMGRFDTANPSEAEAMNAARAMRRMVVEKNLWFVDAICRADVARALDMLLKPAREDSEELKAAFLEVAKYAELARQHAETVNELRQRLAASGVTRTESAGLVNGGLITLAVLTALALMIAAECC
jgi:hypothetical protein